MATRRANVKENAEDTTITSNSTSQQETTKKPPRKLKNIEEKSSHLQWVVFVLVFSLAILGLIYYYNYYQPKITTPTTRDNQKQHKFNESSVKVSKTAKIKSTSKKQNKNTKQQPQATPSNKKAQKENKLGTDLPTKDGEQSNTDDVPSYQALYPPEKLENLEIFPKNLRERLLRLPIPPSDADRPLIMEIVFADDYLVKKEYSKALEKFNELLKRLPQSPRALYGKAIALERIAEKRSNMKVLDNAIEHYRRVSIDSFLAPAIIKEACLIQLVTLLNKRERYDEAITACEKLHKIDPDNDGYAIQLGLTYIKTGRMTEAKEQLQKAIDQWPNNAIAKANLGYMYYLKGNCLSAVPLLMAGLEADEGTRRNARFYRYAGECLVRLNQYNESLDLYKVAVDLELFPSLWQRSLTNVAGLRAQPWWPISETGIEEELLRIVNEAETMKGEVSSLVNGDKFTNTDQTVLTLYSNGMMNEENCHVTTQSCDLVSNIATMAQCANGESKFLLLPSSLHIPATVGFTNTKLRAILPVILTGSLTVRVADETRELQEGVLSVIDDSFEQELWHHSDKNSLILIIEFCHPHYNKRTVQ